MERNKDKGKINLLNKRESLFNNIKERIKIDKQLFKDKNLNNH